jgi:hypothetical protein
MTELDRLRRDCAIAGKLWNRTFSAVLLSAMRSHGGAMLDRLWAALLLSHQDEYFVASLQKLGIADDPPAVAAAKYHYFSNWLGGLGMEYVEESSRKVWIRYLAPSWTYPGTALAALPLGIRRTVFSTWHPRNGELLGCRRLGWVCTKLLDEGDPYDEGYFIEHDRDLESLERARFEICETTPEYDPARAPRLDPQLWPETRLLKANRNYAGAYVRDTIEQLYALIGQHPAHAVVAHAMRVLAAQYTHEIAADLTIADRSVDGIARIYAELLRCTGHEVDWHEPRPKVRQLRLIGLKPFPAPCEELRRALFEFQIAGTRILNGRLRATRERHASGEVWTFVDTGRWLW